VNRIFSRLVRGYAVYAIDITPSTNRKVTPDQLTNFLKAVLQAPAFTAPAVGLGKDVRIAARKPVAGRLGQKTGTSIFAPFRRTPRMAVIARAPESTLATQGLGRYQCRLQHILDNPPKECESLMFALEWCAKLWRASLLLWDQQTQSH
jgi:hypothetical protein